MPSPIQQNNATQYGQRANGLGRAPFNNRYSERVGALYFGGFSPAPGFVFPICAAARSFPRAAFATFTYTPRPQRVFT